LCHDLVFQEYFRNAQFLLQDNFFPPPFLPFLISELCLLQVVAFI
jgi:hypothetical protein